jgi:hypothetical protein
MLSIFRMATAEVMRRYRLKHREKNLQYNREYMRKFMHEKRQKNKDYDTYSKNLRRIDAFYFIY